MKLVLPARTSSHCHVRLPTLLAACLLSACLLATAVIVEPVSAGVLKTQQPCQKNVSKSGRKYLSSVVKTLSKCRESELSGKQSTACDEARTTGALQKAADKIAEKISKGCGGLSTAELADPRPRGLAFGTLESLVTNQQSEHERLARHLVELVYGQRDPSQPAYGKEAMSCQKTLGKGVAKHLKNALKGVGSRCVDRVDRGSTVDGDAFRSVEGCLGKAAARLASDATRAAAKISRKCDDQLVAGLRACEQGAGAARTVPGVVGCLFDNALGVAAAAIELEHAAGGTVINGTLVVADVLDLGDTMRPADAAVILVDPGSGETLASGRTDESGRFSIDVLSYESYRFCWEREGLRTCSTDQIETSHSALRLADQDLAVPRAAGSTLVYGKVLRADVSACYQRNLGSGFIVRGGASLLAASGAQVAARVDVGPDGSYLLLVPSAGDYIVVADCGDETTTAAVSVAGDGGVMNKDLRMTSTGPIPSGLLVTDADGNVITDPALVSEGDELFVQADFASERVGELEYHWVVSRGEGQVSSPSAGRGRRACGPPEPVTGNVMRWIPKGIGKIQQLVVWVRDKNGGLSSAALSFGPLEYALPLDLVPCIWELKDEDELCGDGYDSNNDSIDDLPEPAGGRDNFLSYKFRGDSNSEDDACLYYNLVDPDCVDLDCDGVLDPGSDPDGKCSRLTLGDWWTKNGFDPVTGLGTDVVSAWYLNSNDLGFGREMHCRVTSYSNYLLDMISANLSGLLLPEPTTPVRAAAPSGYPMAEDLYLANTASENPPVAAQYLDLFKGYPATIACYVVNYTTDFCNNYPTNQPHNANLAYEGEQAIIADPAINPTHAYGTVAMEFSPVEGFGALGPVTKFFVYDGRTASGQRLDAANLDGCGAKSVPEVCMSCHGGNWPGGNQGAELDTIVAGLTDNVNCELAGIGITTPGDINDPAWIKRRDLLATITPDGNNYSSFLPFDPKTYVFPPDHLAVASESLQEDNMRALNEMVKYTEPTQAIKNIVGGWYNNNFGSGSFTEWRPTAWNNDPLTPENEADFYDNVYAVSCRGCHAAHLPYDSSEALVGFGPGRVCKNSSGTAGSSSANGVTMAHAKLTYQNFWRADFPQGNALTSLEAYYLARGVSGFTSCD